MVNKLFLVTFIVIVLGCGGNKPLSKSDEIVRLEAQNLNWLMSLKSLRKTMDPSDKDKIDIQIVRNYFPIYLANKERGLNQQQFGIISTSYQSLSIDKVEMEVWRFNDKKKYEDLWLPKFASGYGFDEDQINSYEKMIKLRQEYFDDLKNFQSK